MSKATYDGEILEYGIIRVKLEPAEAYKIAETIEKFRGAELSRDRFEMKKRGENDFWYANYKRYGHVEQQTCYSLDGAVGYLAMGWEAQDLQPLSIKCPDGEVILREDTKFAALVSTWYEGQGRPA